MMKRNTDISRFQASEQVENEEEEIIESKESDSKE